MGQNFRSLSLSGIFLFFLWPVAFAIIYFIRSQDIVTSYELFNDFYSYYFGSVIFWEGHNPYILHPYFMQLYEQVRTPFLVGTGYSYPPLLAILMYPLTRSPLIWAIGTVTVLSTVAYIAFCRHIVQSQTSSPRQERLLYLYLVTYIPVFGTIINGQINVFILLALYYYLYTQNGHVLLRGTALALAAYIKVYPGILALKSILQRRYSDVGAIVLSGSIITAAIVIFDRELYIIDYFTRVLPGLNFGPDTYYTNQSLNGFASRLFPSYLSYIAPFVTFPISLILMLMLVYVTITHKDSKEVSLLWLGILSLLAGKNSFWNFTPCVLIGLYLIKSYARLSGGEQKMFMFSTIITNGLWAALYPLYLWLLPGHTLLLHIPYALVGSMGSFALAAQCLLLVRLIYRPHKL